jgi:hypothetical protein
LACLEVLVHIRDIGLIPADYVFYEIDMPDEVVGPWLFTGEEALAKIESPVLSREYGDAWFHRTWFHRTTELRGPVIQTVPSVIVPREMNYIISPLHPRFAELVWSEPRAFQFDPRLI